MTSMQVDGMKPQYVHEALTVAAEHVRAGNGPYFLEINTYRYRGHSVSDPGNYRSKEEVEYYKTLDPLLTTEEYLLKNNIFSSEDLATLQEQVTEEMDEAVRFAEESPLPDPEGLYEDNYSEPYPYLV